ncbi:MAG: ATP-dependent helicase [Nocardioidaceae bacterium]
MTATTITARPVLLHDTDHLCRVLGVPYSDEQLAAIISPVDQPGVIVAGAGSGKTEVMAARVVWLVGKGHVDPGSVLGLTFTNKAASELASRIRLALQRLADDAGIGDFLQEGGEPVVSTYHAYGGSLIAEHGLRLGYEPDLQVIADASRFQRAARAVQTHRGGLALTPTHVPTLVGDVIALDGQMADHLVGPVEVREFDAELRRLLATHKQVKDVAKAVRVASHRDEIVSLVEGYRALKSDAGVMDFSDQMVWGARLASECPEVSETERSRFAVVLLDEYQDTSVAQRMMLQGLFSGADASSGRGHPVTAVGDPCQAIYGWRGASADNLTQFLDHFRAADGGRGAELGLSVNRRCGTSILDVANTLATPFYDASDVVVALRPSSGAIAGTVRAACLPTVEDEIEWLVDQVSAVRAQQSDAASHWSDIAVLVRDKNEVASLAAAFRTRDVPVEVVGMSGLLQQPEVEDVVATLEVVDSLTANAALLRLLTGPRFNIGARDLALLGTRARQLVGTDLSVRSDDLVDELSRAVSGVDPSDILSLADAVDDPGTLAYSQAAERRFADLSRVLGRLRVHATEPLPDLVRQVIVALDLDVELAVQHGPAAVQARNNLALLVDAVTEFVGTEPSASTSALLAYLRAEEDFNSGMEVAAPSETDSVKLLTVHKAKGLEWRHVFVPFMSAEVFPSGKARDRWVSTARELPADLRGDADSQPQVTEWTPAGLSAYRTQSKQDALLEELRLGYVAFTRAKATLVVSGHWWGRTQIASRGPSAYLQQVRKWLQAAGSDASVWAEDPRANLPDGQDPTNPLVAQRAIVAWPAPTDGPWVRRRREVAAELRTVIAVPPAHQAAVPDRPDALDADQRSGWERLSVLDGDIVDLVAEAQVSHRDTVEVARPATLSATAVARLRDDPDGFARALARPMPRRPAPSARFGTRFHAWIEAHFGQQMLLAEDELPGRDVTDIRDDTELADVIAAFSRGPFADRRPHAIEAPFSLRLAGQEVRGRIDAVYRTAHGFEVVDWKTNRRADADQLQLAIYRLAWAETHDLDLSEVTAAFYYVRLGRTVRYADLPGRDQLEAVVAGTHPSP